MNDFCMQTAKQGDVSVLSFSGYLGHSQCYWVVHELVRLLRQGMRSVVLDCTQVSCITHSGLTNLHDYARELQKHGGQLRLAGLPHGARYNAELVGFDHETLRQPDVASALKSLGR